MNRNESANTKKKALLRLPQNSSFLIRFALFFLLPFYFLPFAVSSQDVHFSQPDNVPQLLNPATSGMGEGTYRIAITQRLQWVALTKYNTSSASYDMPLFKGGIKFGYLGAGFNFYSDRAGTANLGTTRTTFSVSGILPMGEHHKLSVGLQSGIAHSNAKIEKLTWGNQFNGNGFDQSISAGENPNLAYYAYVGASAGVNYEFKIKKNTMLGKSITKTNAGIAIFNPRASSKNFLTSQQRKYSKWVFHGMGYKEFNEIKFALIPSFSYFIEGPHTEMNTGLRLRYRFHEGSKWSGVFSEGAFSIACQYRLKDAIIPAVFLEFGNYLLSFSYDYPISMIQKAGKVNSFEVSIVFSKLNSDMRVDN